MPFTEDLSTAEGLGLFNTYLSDKTYVSGYAPSDDDLALFDKLSEEPSAEMIHAARWYRHIASLTTERKCADAADTAEDDDGDFELFGDENSEEERIREELTEKPAQEQLDKKSDKPAAKSSVIFDVKPWDGETDLKVLEKKVREISMDGLLWGASEIKPIAYGINKLQIVCTIVDDLVSSDTLQEKIEELEDEVQSVDIANFTKL